MGELFWDDGGSVCVDVLIVGGGNGGGLCCFRSNLC